MVFGLGNNAPQTGFQLVQFDTSILGSYYQARVALQSAATSPLLSGTSLSRGAAVETPWDNGEDTRSIERRVNEVRKIDRFIDEGSEEAQRAGDDRDAKALFTLYRALTKLQTIAEYAADANTTNATRGPLEVLMRQGIGEIQDYLATTELDKLDLLYGAKSNRVESRVTLGKNESKVIGQVIQTGARDDPIPGLTGTEDFTVSITKSGETQDFNIDLATIAGPITLQALVNEVNSQISAVQAVDGNGDPVFDDDGNPVAKFQARFTIEDVGEDVGEEGYALAVSGLTIEKVRLSAAATEPSLFLAGTSRAVGTDALSSATLTRIDGIAGADPSAGLTKTYNATGEPILEVPEADENEALASQRANAVVDEIRKQVSDLFTELEIGDEDDGLTRPPVETTAAGVAVDSEGHVFVIGATEGDIDSQLNRADGSDVYLTKYDASGTVVWQRLLGASGSADGYGIAIDSADNVIVAGKVDGTLDGSELYDGPDSFVVKFDNSGDRLWTGQLDSLAEDGALSVAVDANDDILISGYSSGLIASSETYGGSRDAFVARLSGTDGALDLAAQYGGAASETVKEVAIANDGNILVLGEEDGRAVLRKLDQTDLSTELWSVDLGDLQAGAVTGLAVEGGSVYVAGTTDNAAIGGGVVAGHQGGQDGFVIRVDDAGGSAGTVWTSFLGTGSSDRIEDISVSGGNVYVAGKTAGSLDGVTSSGVTDAFAAKIDGTDGSHQWVEQIAGGAGFNGATGLAFSSNGSSVLTTLGLGPGTLQNQQTRDVAAQTTLRPGDHFYISINGGTERKITIREGDTFAKIASRINRLSFQYIEAEESFSGDGKGLKISVKNGSTIQILPGADGEDALRALGLEATKILPTDKSFNLNEEDEDKIGGVFGLKLEAGMSLSTERAAKYALKELEDAVAEIQRAYRSLTVNPLAELLKQQAAIDGGTVPPALQAQLANYQAGLFRLTAGGGGGGGFLI